MVKEPVEKKEGGNSEDRFEKISNNYGELFSEVFAEQGLDYVKLERSVFEVVDQTHPDLNTPVLDIGTGDGATIEPFVRAGYTNLTGIDLNPQMLEANKKRFGERVCGQ